MLDAEGALAIEDDEVDELDEELGEIGVEVEDEVVLELVLMLVEAPVDAEETTDDLEDELEVVGDELEKELGLARVDEVELDETVDEELEGAEVLDTEDAVLAEGKEVATASVTTKTFILQLPPQD